MYKLQCVKLICGHWLKQIQSKLCTQFSLIDGVFYLPFQPFISSSIPLHIFSCVLFPYIVFYARKNLKSPIFFSLSHTKELISQKSLFLSVWLKLGNQSGLNVKAKRQVARHEPRQMHINGREVDLKLTTCSCADRCQHQLFLK